jgi:hypothetical protein
MIKRLCLVLVFMMGLCLVAPTPVSAASPLHNVAAAGPCGKDIGVDTFLGLKSWDSCLTKDALGVPQISKLSDIWLILIAILEDAIKVAGYAAAGFVIWGGIKYIKSQGDPGQINEARQVIYNALFGLVLAMISVAIVNFVAGAI